MPRLVLLAVAATLSLPAAPLWRNLGPGGGGWIQSILASRHNPEELFVGCDVGGFYRSDNAGESYTIHNRGLEDYFVECILQHPADANILYLGCQSGVYRSTDRGRSWTWLREGFPPIERYRWSAPVAALVMDPRDSATLYAGIGSPRGQKWGTGTIYRSTDGGDSWQRINQPGSLPEDALIGSLAIDPRNSARLLAATQHGVFRSDDGGQTWQASSAGLPHRAVRRLALCPARPDVVYLTLSSIRGAEPWQGGVYRSDDGGQTWTARNHGLKQTVGPRDGSINLTSWYDQLAVHPQDPDIAYVGGQGWVNAELYQTLDGGASWLNVVRRGENGNFDPGWITMWGPSVMCLTMSPLDPNTLYFGTSGMVYRTRDAGGSWEQVYCRQLPDGRFHGTGLEVTCLHNIMPDPQAPDRVYFGFYDIGLLRSDDAGQTFRRGVKGIGPVHSMANSCFALAFGPDRLWGAFGQWGANQGVVASSTDDGLSWTMLPPESGLPSARCRHLIRQENSLFAALDEHGVYVSRDGGTSWQAANRGLPNTGIRSLQEIPGTKDAFLCVLGSKGKELGGVYRSEDGCRTWRKISGDFPVGDVKNFQIATADSRLVYLAMRDRQVGDVPVPGGVYRSEDGGATWKQVLRNHFAQGLAVHPGEPRTILAGLIDHPYHDQSTGGGVLGSRDGGETWVSLNDDSLSVRQVNVLRFDPHRPERVFAGTGGNAAFVTILDAATWAALPEANE